MAAWSHMLDEPASGETTNGGWQQASKAIIGGWLLCTLAFALPASGLIGNTKLEVHSPPGTASHTAVQAFRHNFPEQSREESIVILVQDVSSHGNFSDHLCRFSDSVQHELESASGQWGNSSLKGYCTMHTAEAKRPFVDNLEHPTISYMVLTVQKCHALKMVGFLTAQVLPLALASVGASLTGRPVFMIEGKEGSMKDMEGIDAVGLPSALLLFALCVNKLRFIIIPCCNIAAVASCSFGIMYIVSLYIDVTSIAPSMMMSFVLAMAIDYSLFNTSRLLEETQKGMGLRAAIKVMVVSSGHTIVLSGLTLICCFIAVASLDLPLVGSMSIGCIVTLSVSILCATTLTPSMLLLFPSLSNDQPVPPWLQNVHDGFVGWISCNPQDQSATRARRVSVVDAVNEKVDLFWIQMSKFTTQYSVTILVLLLASNIPFIWYSAEVKLGMSFELCTSKYMPGTIAYQAMMDEWGSGVVMPYQMLVVPPKGTRVDTKEFNNECYRLIECLCNTTRDTELIMFEGAMIHNGSHTPFYVTNDKADTGLHAAGTAQQRSGHGEGINHQASSVDVAKDRYMNKDKSATYVDIFLPFDVSSPRGQDWIVHFRHSMTHSNHTYELYLLNGMAETYDCVVQQQAAMPVLMGAMSIAIFFLAGINFRSVIIPVITLVTVMMSLSWSFGAAVMVYQYGTMSWFPWEAIEMKGAVYWIAPLISLPVSAGLGLDYDIFLILRIQEYRKDGFSSRDSVVLALQHTGGVIVSAGLIMMVTFSAMMLSSNPTLEQMALFIVLAVLSYTMVMCNFFLPACINLADDLSWWPVQMPPVTKTIMSEAPSFSQSNNQGGETSSTLKTAVTDAGGRVGGI